MLYPHAVWKGAAVQDYSRARIHPRLVVVHVAQGGEAGIVPWFHNPKAEVSAHLFNPKVGPMLQFVDLTQTAYAEMAYNDESISIEHEGFSGERLTVGQVQRLRAAAHFLHRAFGIPPKWRDDAFSGPGWTSHGDLGPEGGDHPQCPGAPIVGDVRALLRTVARFSVVVR